jgi:hypothetical protein
MFIGFNRKKILLDYFVAVYNDQQEDLNEKTITTRQAKNNYGFIYWLHVWGDDPLKAKLLYMLKPNYYFLANL